ncbi:bromodomain adjacent to zinc finger domain protein 2B isoform X2 [Triplophysa dalaica]|uniref:bromodomain adjacent to zinc finger domain protein 2B isoform X2 n=1 Tax=Triplophysa dalaica TaxID=1582913 RepID=UPI0024DF34C3|nr:bromodomain adjacent to zinc finger domain protein 2B isoform X2 [Triplophysa dalaica]
MESAERLEPSTPGQTPIRSKGKPRDSSSTANNKKGHLFGMLGNQGLGVSSVSGVFPMMHHSSASVRSEFGGLGTLGMSVALSARSHLGALPDWWRTADAQGQGSAVLFPHLLGLPALFSMPSLNQEQNLIQSRAASKDTFTPAQGLNGSVNGKGKSSPVSSAPSPVLTASDQTRIPKPAVNHLKDRTRLKTKGKLCRKLPVVSFKTDSQSPSNNLIHDSQSASTSDSSSEALHSSDSDDLEDDDDDDDDDQTDDSVESECAKDLRGMKKGEMQTETKKNHHSPVLDARDRLSFNSTHMESNPLLFQVFRPSHVPGKHTSVIQATGLPTSTNPLGLVTQSFKDRDVPSPTLLSHSSPKPVSVTPSPNPLSLSSSPKSSSLTPSPKCHSVSSSPVPASRSPSSRAPSLQSDNIKSGRNYLDETLLNFSKLRQSFLPQEPMKQALSSALRGAQTKISSPSFSQTLESQNSQKSFFNHLFLPLLPMESHHPNGVQDAPLALITKPRSQNSRTPEKPLLAVNSPVNLSTTGTWQTSTEPVEMGRTFTSSALTSAASGGNGCKSGRGEVKRGRETPMGQFRGAESDLASSNDSEDSLMDEENDVTNDSLSDSDSNLDSDSDDEDDAKHEDVDSDMEVERMPLKPFSSSLDTSLGRTTSPVPLNLQVHKTPAVGVPTIVSTIREPTNHNSTLTSDSVATPPGKRRRVTDETALRKPLEYGWQRETRITNTCGRLRGVVAYYAPCGRKIKQYPDVMKYLSKHGISDITRDHFCFSAKIKVGDFYEARDGPQGAQWYLLKEEEVVSRILAMEGRRGRPRNPERSDVPAVSPSHSSRRVCGVDESKADGLSVSEVKLLRRLEAQEIARQAAQMKLIRKLEKQALARAAKEARRQQAIMQAEERKKQKEHMKVLKQQEKIKRIQQIRMEKEFRAQQILEAKRKRKEEAANARMLEAEKRMKEKELRRQQAVILKLQERERHRQHVMLMKTMEARKKAEEKERVKQEKRDEKRINKQRRQELRRLELEMSRELNKPNEDMCLSDHEPLPALSRIPGLVLPGVCFADCLMVMQFLRCFGKVLGFDISAEVPSLAVLQAGLLNVGDHMTLIQDLLVRMLSAALCDPGLPPGYRVKTALGDHVTNVRLDRDNVSEVLQIYMEAQCGQTDFAPLAESLKTKAFQAHTPSQKASILAFLANELTCSKSVISEIDRNIDSMTSLRREKWLVEGNLRKLKRVHSKRTGKRESNGGLEERQTLNTPATGRKRKRKSGESEDDDEEEDEDSEEQGEDDEEDYGGKRGKKADACEEEEECNQTSSIEELEKQIEKLSKQQSQVRRKLFEVSHSLGSVMFGQDRYKRRYWVLPQCGGVFVEATERSEGPEELQRERERLKTTSLIQVKEERLETPKESRLNAQPDVKHEPASLNEVDSLNLFLQKPGSFSKLGKLLEVAMMSDETKQTALPSSPASVPSTYLRHANQQLHKVLTGRNSHWFSLLPRYPCDGSSLTEGPATLPLSTSSSSSPQTSSGWVPCPSATSPAVSGPNSAASISNSSLMPLRMKSCMSVMDLPFCSWSNGNVSSSGVSMAPILGGLYPPTEVSRDVNPFLNTRRRDSPTSPGVNPLSTPSPAIEMSKHQDYPLPHPVPKEMLSGWWRVTDIGELRSIEKACHSRGIRERALQKQLQKHMVYISQLCAKNRDVTVIESSELEKHQISEETVYSWCVDEQVMDVDIGVLQQVEELELRVTSANLQVKGWMPPAAQSHSEHLVYHEHKPVIENNQSDDRSDHGIVRRANNPLDIAVMRLEELERNIERRYLKSPLNSGVQIRMSHTGTVTAPSAPSPAGDDEDGVEEDLSPGLKQWRQALGEVRSSSQLSMCIQQLHKSIAWDKFIIKVDCQICNMGENEDLLLLCDGCDGSCHTYCHKPKITGIPSGDWFCPACVSRANRRSLKSRKPSNRSSEELKKHSEVKRDGKASATGGTSEDESGRASSSPSKVTKEAKKRKTEDPSTGPVECVKQVTTARDNSKDVTICRILLAELESHQDAWPFMRPVDPKSVPGYRKVIRKPMDFSTIRDKLTNSQYLNLETFIIDVNLVFDNCERFNEDHSDIGRAGHTMRRFFHGRWTELLKQKLA